MREKVQSLDLDGRREEIMRWIGQDDNGFKARMEAMRRKEETEEDQETIISSKHSGALFPIPEIRQSIFRPETSSRVSLQSITLRNDSFGINSTFSKTLEESEKEERRKYIFSWFFIMASVINFFGLCFLANFWHQIPFYQYSKTEFSGNPIDSERHSQLRHTFQSVTSESLFQYANSPQSKALYWISYMDRLHVGVPQNSAQEEKVIQRYILASLFFGFGGKKWTDGLKFLSGLDECEWNGLNRRGAFYGVKCVNGKVTHIIMNNNNLQGHVLEEIAELKELSTLSLANNSLYGVIPSKLLGMTALKTLHFHGNNLSGSLNFLCENKDIHEFSSDCLWGRAKVSCWCCTSCGK